MLIIRRTACPEPFLFTFALSSDNASNPLLPGEMYSPPGLCTYTDGRAHCELQQGSNTVYFKAGEGFPVSSLEKIWNLTLEHNNSVFFNRELVFFQSMFNIPY